MKLRVALELGVDCGLKEVGEAIYNIRLRVGQLFTVDEYRNLVNECNELKVNSDDSITEWLDKLDKEYYVKIDSLIDEHIFGNVNSNDAENKSIRYSAPGCPIDNVLRELEKNFVVRVTYVDRYKICDLLELGSLNDDNPKVLYSASTKSVSTSICLVALKSVGVDVNF